MTLVIHTHQVTAPRDLEAFVRKHFIQPLQRLHDGSADELTVYVADVRPRKGGNDQSCAVTFRMPGSKALRVESVADDIHASLLDCAQRMKRLVQRQVEKARTPSRSRLTRPLGRTWRARSSRDGTSPDGTPSTL